MKRIFVFLSFVILAFMLIISCKSKEDYSFLDEYKKKCVNVPGILSVRQPILR